nr:immunoglobulin light chain junction region [Macaca mulatta]MOV62017.1 immunoglobulin light chain junction region [Macaca mulatta]MOV62049.1 immunoglobulin light chain junction region [Macaca mulatta]MOV62164.1 immunoglobulin light chain junction region [Macaca mulatta]MOV63193.1 immunoglobulin light chain junction region [Macaca mulatta]
CQQYINYPTF